MSKIIRSSPEQSGTKIIQLRKVESRRPFEAQADPDIEQYGARLKMEVSELEDRLQALQKQLEDEQQQAHTELEMWREQQRQRAEEEAQQLAKSAAQEGFQTGFEQGHQQAEAEFLEKRELMEGLIGATYEEQQRIIRGSEPFLLSLSTEIARKIIRNELKQDEGQLLSIIHHALRQVDDAEEVVIHLALEDYPAVLPFEDELTSYIRAGATLKLMPVAGQAPSGCMIHTKSGSYDATVDSQVAEIKKQLLMYCEEKSNDEIER
ncbi:FliH/SctL family protein [Planococcus dechangensis]|uniref:FliH/SctL family protein n=1 Tax=Planococcus dechangensis TaxID=1176255 RepID=A0ABV9MAK7_9BACL